MNLNINLDRGFERTLDSLVTEYGDDMATLSGIGESQLDTQKFISSFRSKNLIDASIDGNANVHQKDVFTIQKESAKPLNKLQGYSKIFSAMTKTYNYRTAVDWFRGEFNGESYLHNADTAAERPYCYAFDLTRLATEGLFFIKDYNSEPPKHLTTFLDDVVEFISFMCNRMSGAVGLPNLLIWTYYFWKHDCKEGYFIKNIEYYEKQCFQKLIYRLNQPFIRVDESSFVNVSIFDREYLKSLFGGVEYPDGTLLMDEIEGLIEHQKSFMEVVSEIRNKNVFTFPVLTYSLLKRNDISEEEKNHMLKSRKFNVFVDGQFARWCSDHNTKWYDSNFFMSRDVGVLSNCCFDGSQTVLAKVGDTIVNTSFWDFYDRFAKQDDIQVYHNGNWVGGRLIRLPSRKMYRVVTVNNKEIIVTDNHLCPTQRGDVPAAELTEDDYLMFSNRELRYPSNHTSLKYEDGVMVALAFFCGELEQDENGCPIVKLNVPYETFCEKKDCIKWSGVRNGDEILIPEIDGKVAKYTIMSPGTTGLLTKFVEFHESDNNSFDSDFSVLLESTEFRRGVIDGSIACTNEKGTGNSINELTIPQFNQIEVLATTLGLQTESQTSRVAPRINMIFAGDPDSRESEERIVRNNSDFWRVRSVMPCNKSGEFVYCFEMDDLSEPYFTLPNGIITHNCRLLSDTRKLDAFINSIGGTALSIGSVQVNTINLVRIAYESMLYVRNTCGSGSPESRFLEMLADRTRLCCKVLNVIRNLIQENIQSGLLPNYCEGGIELAKQYCTIGILGLYEVIEIFGMLEKDEFGNISYTERGVNFASQIFKTINRVKDNFNAGYSFNIESVPAERAAVILAQKDKLFFAPYKEYFPYIEDKFIYSNQWIPLTEKTTIQEKLRVSSILDAKCSGGAISHINLEGSFPTTDAAWDMLNYIALEDVIYSAFNIRINVCKNNHGFIGSPVCPVCGEPVVDTAQRVVGFITRASRYSTERSKEFNARRWFDFAQTMKE